MSWIRPRQRTSAPEARDVDRLRPAEPEPLLRMRDVHVAYGGIEVLHGIDLQVGAAEIVCLLGGNASGKSTTMKTVLGSVRPTRGEVQFDGRRVDGMDTADRVKAGIAIVPEGRRIFSRLSVRENLALGAFVHSGPQVAEDLERVLELFPRLRERLPQAGGTLSGGEQQMLAIGRALMSRPRLLCMDEPSMGLAPVLVETVFEIVQRLHDTGITIFMVEQNAVMALSVADRGYVLQAGRIVLSGRAADLLEHDEMRRAYLGTA
ncbi:MAG TPA: ABC transporter ATP-binding protein [Candidatus Dormibacteraeota bacterium]|nr:ABC transporter ATP-binding protein [Candidatus Dormibacteraeota bacterium]